MNLGDWVTYAHTVHGLVTVKVTYVAPDDEPDTGPGFFEGVQICPTPKWPGRTLLGLRRHVVQNLGAVS